MSQPVCSVDDGTGFSWLGNGHNNCTDMQWYSSCLHGDVSIGTLTNGTYCGYSTLSHAFRTVSLTFHLLQGLRRWSRRMKRKVLSSAHATNWASSWRGSDLEASGSNPVRAQSILVHVHQSMFKRMTGQYSQIQENSFLPNHCLLASHFHLSVLFDII
jgi:hypothetical protein